ncbi:hypothetical protein ACKKBG_A18175 [Auxenochlorella protothecoides x Auxenochlorella symbiontica]
MVRLGTYIYGCQGVNIEIVHVPSLGVRAFLQSHGFFTLNSISAQVKAPRVRESAVQMECKVVHSYEVRNAAGAVSTTVILAQVVLMHVADGVAGNLGSARGGCIVEWRGKRETAPAW